ncbi:MAG: YdjY domain-containing protein [Verrucomicrobiota bacterium]
MKQAVLTFFAAALSVAVNAQDPEKPSIKKIGESTFKVGQIEFDAKARSVSIPVEVNAPKQDQPVEYALVQEKGKIHESLLTTTASPTALEIAFRLLKYPKGHGEVFSKLLPAEDRKIKAEETDETGAEVEIIVEWEEEGEKQSAALHTWIIDGKDGEVMDESAWVYTGSTIYNGTFMAESEGSIIAIYLDPAAMVNTSVEGAEIDERWGPNQEEIPEIGTKATLTIRPKN